MLQKTNFEGAKALLLEYLENKDYSKPFILAGWSGVGKTPAINQVKDDTCMDFEVVTYNLDVDKRKEEILDQAQLNSDVPRVFEITINTGAELRTLLQYGFNVYWQEIDFYEFIDWASKIDEGTGRQNIDAKYVDFIRHTHNLSILNKGYEKMADIEEKIDEFLQKVANYEGNDIDELDKVATSCTNLIIYRYISQTDASNCTNKLLEALKKQMETKPEMGLEIYRMVRNLAELFGTCLF